ncbi:ABC transporter permease [Rhizobium changzhiense]|uniref:ABC transporter permease n=2 Tax=Rhizobium TaxID=379 RepID=A0A6N9ZI55_9HYPH|nr:MULTISPECIES: ABC transporter permease [Rhizobium]MCH4549533.1 ABC transporter permease [Rhizobium changzhiense]NEH92976.1 ABC transporter permease [Rhizobium laguerreae]NKN01063.1 ABC transporter permease [Rhizobium leguminosarum bv. viciae]NZD63138.1 ABC transporter permease [Rhizobium changzhiense]
MPKTIQRWTRSHEFWLLAVVIVLSMFLTAATDSFLTLQNLFDLLTSTSFAGILAAGLLVVLVFGGIDISFTAIASVAQYVALMIAKTYPIGWFGVFLVACCTGILCGLFNAAIIHKVRISSVIVTISTLNIFYGLLIYSTRGDYITSLPSYFREGIWWFEFTDSNGFPYAINFQALLLVVAFFMTWVLLNKTNIGRQIYAMGGNEIAAERLGFHVFGLRCLVYGYMGFMAAIASISQAQLAQSVTPTTLIGKELEVLAAVVLGGASLAGGNGSVFGAVLGVMLIAILQNGLILLGVSSYWNQFFVGCVILLAVSATALSQRRRHAGLAS